jgi:hypothetical protein
MCAYLPGACVFFFAAMAARGYKKWKKAFEVRGRMDGGLYAAVGNSYVF